MLPDEDERCGCAVHLSRHCERSEAIQSSTGRPDGIVAEFINGPAEDRTRWRGMTERESERPGAIPAFYVVASTTLAVIVREGGRSSTPRQVDSITGSGDYWMPRLRGA
jgi:hypothetical protein